MLYTYIYIYRTLNKSYSNKNIAIYIYIHSNFGPRGHGVWRGDDESDWFGASTSKRCQCRTNIYRVRIQPLYTVCTHRKAATTNNNNNNLSDALAPCRTWRRHHLATQQLPRCRCWEQAITACRRARLRLLARVACWPGLRAAEQPALGCQWGPTSSLGGSSGV